MKQYYYYCNYCLMLTQLYFFVRKSGFLGSGEFATVDKGVWRGSKGTVDVAVKTLSESATEAEKIRFLQEAVVMGQFVHPNIVQLHGIVTRGDPVSNVPCSNVPHPQTQIWYIVQWPSTG